MTDALQVYSDEEFSVRTMKEDGEIWFVAKDIAEALEYSENSTPAQLTQSVPTIWKGIKRIDTVNRGMQEMLCLTEQGVYFFLGRSDKAKALPYQMWIAGEVVPSIRKTGSYNTSPTKEELEIKRQELEIRITETNLHRAEFIRSMLDNPPFLMTPETKTVFAHEAFKLASGHDYLAMLPVSHEKWYTATQIGNILGITSNKVGRIAKKHGIKAPEGECNDYGRWIFSKAAHSNREVPSFIYSSEALEWFKEHKEDVA